MKVCDIDDFDFDFEDVLSDADENSTGLWEESFLESLREKYDNLGEKMFISEKQIEILCRIAHVEPPATSTSLDLF